MPNSRNYYQFLQTKPNQTKPNQLKPFQQSQLYCLKNGLDETLNQTLPHLTKPKLKACDKEPKLDSFRFGTARLNLFLHTANVTCYLLVKHDLNSLCTF